MSLRGHLAMCRDVLAATAGGCYLRLVGGGRLLNIPHGKDPRSPTQTHLVKNSNRAEKPCSKKCGNYEKASRSKAFLALRHPHLLPPAAAPLYLSAELLLCILCCSDPRGGLLRSDVTYRMCFLWALLVF